MSTMEAPPPGSPTPRNQEVSPLSATANNDPSRRVSRSPDHPTVATASVPVDAAVSVSLGQVMLRRSQLQSADGTSICDERYEKMACTIYDEVLKPAGWYHRNGILHNRMFFPGSLSKFKVADIKKHGTQGVHCVDGWGELGLLIEGYGMDKDFAPKSLQDFPQELSEGQIKPLAEIYADHMKSTEVAASETAAQKAPKKRKGDNDAADGGAPAYDGAEAAAMKKRRKKKKPAPASNSTANPPLVAVADAAGNGGRPAEARGGAPKCTPTEAAADAALKSIQDALSNVAKVAAEEKKHAIDHAAELEEKLSKSKASEAQWKAGCARSEEEKARLEEDCQRLQIDNERIQRTCRSLKEDNKGLRALCTARDEEIKNLGAENQTLARKLGEKERQVQSLLQSAEQRSRPTAAGGVQQPPPQLPSAVSRSTSSEENEYETSGQPKDKDSEQLMAKIEAQMTAGKADIPDVHFDEIIGNKDAKDTLQDLPMCQDGGWVDDGGFEDSEGILLIGPPGTGKTLFAKALASHGNANFIAISPDDILDEYLGNSEKKTRAYFAFAKRKARESGNTSVMFFDECDRLFGKPGKNDCNVASNIIGIFQECMNGVKEPKGQVVVLAATNYPMRLPEPVRSRFGSMVKVGLPSADERVEITKLHIGKKKKLHSDMNDEDYTRLAEETEGASGRDLKNLIKNAMKVQRLSTKNHCRWWHRCKDDAGVFEFEPCCHGLKADCGAEEFSYGDQPAGSRLWPYPLSFAHFAAAIEKYGVTPKYHEDLQLFEED